MTTAQMSLITVVVDGLPLGVFDTIAGGSVSADMTKHRPGGMSPEKSYPGLGTYEDVTVTRVFELERDVEKSRLLTRRAGRASGSVNDQPLDDEGSPWGKPTTYTGKLMSVNRGEGDSNSSDPRMLELVFQITDVA